MFLGAARGASSDFGEENPQVHQVLRVWVEKKMLIFQEKALLSVGPETLKARVFCLSMVPEVS